MCGRIDSSADTHKYLIYKEVICRVTTNALKNKWNLLFFHPERIQCSAGRKSRDMTF